jgi:hypothetical protein
VALSIDTSRPARSRAEQLALVRAVFEAPAGEQETNFLEWKGRLDLAGRNAGGRAAIAKAVLGFGNRNPDLAVRNMDGCACFLAGVSPGELTGMEVVDAAQLESQVAGFVGPNISWRADYVELEGHNVLVVTVEPPRWGDPVHPARKTYNPEGGGRSALQEGTVYVRHQASTERATAADMDMLSRRAARRPGAELELDVGVAPETRLRAVDLSPARIAEYIEQEGASLLAPLSGVGPWRQVGGAYRKLEALGAEYRSEEMFRSSVREYLHELEEVLPDALRARSVVHQVARLKLEVVNNTDKTFTGVRVELLLPLGLEAWEEPDDARQDAELPSPPAPYGTGRVERLSPFGGVSVPSLRPVVPPTVPFPEIEHRPDGLHVALLEPDVRAQGVTPLRSVWLVIGEPGTEALEIRWEATATNAEGRLTGHITVPVAGPAAGISELLAELPEDH